MGPQAHTPQEKDTYMFAAVSIVQIIQDLTVSKCGARIAQSFLAQLLALVTGSFQRRCSSLDVFQQLGRSQNNTFHGVLTCLCRER
jgi:hypothetical protein